MQAARAKGHAKGGMEIFQTADGFPTTHKCAHGLLEKAPKYSLNTLTNLGQATTAQRIQL